MQSNISAKHRTHILVNIKKLIKYSITIYWKYIFIILTNFIRVIPLLTSGFTWRFFFGKNHIQQWLITIFVTCNLCWSLPVQTLMWTTYSLCPTVGPSIQWVLSCWCSLILLSCILWETTALTGGKKPSPPVSPTSLWSSCSLVLAYLCTHVLQPPSPWIKW